MGTSWYLAVKDQPDLQRIYIEMLGVAVVAWGVAGHGLYLQ